jgi:hypothetical protein
MKFSKLILAFSLICLSFAAQAQVGIGTNSPAASAQLEVNSTTKGFLPPRMTQAQRNLISNPVAGLIVYCTNCGSGELQGYNGSAWTNMIGGTASTSTVTLGQIYQGGKVAYILQSGDPGYDANTPHGLIAATADLNAISWSIGNNFTVTNATGTALGTGLTNTNTIISSQGTAVNYAAKICREYNGGSYTDWYLPSKDELNKLYLNRSSIGGFVTSMAFYWSSSEVNLSSAWLQEFDGGTQYNSMIGKDVAGLVRPIRSF